MKKATKVKMHEGHSISDSVLEIKDIYLTGFEKDGYYSKEEIHDHLINNPGVEIKVNIHHFLN